ncbi:MAG: T9SS type A sorting domain-containing protein [Crocinitomicaceae bacterium]|nr:T9SS type A sorting domain-containing protein [Flavobacteriales bacterium]NQZ36828.1 T9SS type A sorting domain-containing protein [Crocinitomicaceae bacterium]
MINSRVLKRLMVTCLLGIVCCTSQDVYGQFFEDKFDELDDQIDNVSGGDGLGNGYTVHPYANANSIFTDGAGPVMQSYIKMYGVTSMDKYLDKLIIHSKNVQDRRDDQPGVNDVEPIFEVDDVLVTVTRSRPNSPTWSTAIPKDNEWYTNVLNAGKITVAMSEFIHLVKVEELSLQTKTLPTMPFTHPSNQLTISTYGEYADWLIVKLFETINYYDNPVNHDDVIYEITQWRKPKFWGLIGDVNVFTHVDQDLDFYSGGVSYALYRAGGWLMGNELNDWNQNHGLAKTLVLLSETLKEIAPADPRIDYLDMKLGILARIFKVNIELVGNHFEWTFRSSYSCPGGLPHCDEDISHAAESVDFPFMAYKYGLTFSNGTPLFNELDIDRFARSITQSAYYEPLRILNSIDGTDFFYRLPDGETDYFTMTNFFRRALGRWLNFTEYDSYISGYDYTSGDIYQMASEIFLDEYVIHDGAFSYNAESLIGIANLAFYQKSFNPIGVNRMAGADIQWAGVAGGDFDSDGVDEFITVSNFEGNFYMYEYEKDHLFDITLPPKDVSTRAYEYQINHIASENNAGAASDWVDVTAGDFDISHSGDEFVAVRNFDGKFYMYELNGGLITSSASYLMSAGQNWIGLASGDMDGDGKVEFAALEEGTNKLYIFEMNTGVIALDADILNNGFNIGAGNWSGLGSGDFDGDNQTELVSGNNSNGNIVIFKVNSGNIQIEIVNTAAGAGSQWTDFTGGDFDGDGIDEFIAHRNIDGVAWIYELQDGAMVAIGKEQFTGGQQQNVWGSGNFVSSLTNSRDEIIALRNLDGAQLMYSLEGLCGNGHPCPLDLIGFPNPGSNGTPNQLTISSSLYPNPSSNISTLTFEISEGDNLTIELFDHTGFKLNTLFDQFVQGEQAQTLSINRGNLINGMYYVVIYSSTGAQTSLELILE